MNLKTALEENMAGGLCWLLGCSDWLLGSSKSCMGGCLLTHNSLYLLKKAS